MRYRRAATLSADVTLSVARREYRAEVKDPASLGRLQTLVGAARRRRLAPSAQETNKANRRRFGRRTRPDRGAGEVATSIKGAWDQPQAGPCPRCNLVKRLLTKRPSEPQTIPKNRRPFHPQDGAPARKRRGRGGEKHVSGLLPPVPHASKTFAERQIKHKNAFHNAKKAPCMAARVRKYGFVRMGTECPQTIVCGPRQLESAATVAA